MKFDNQLRYGVEIIETFKGEIPLHAWLKNYFKQHPQMGSKDRKLLSNMVYGFYRLGHAVIPPAVEERILTGFFLCNHVSTPFLRHFRPEWDDLVALPLQEKFKTTGMHDAIPAVFPWKDACSEGIDPGAFCESFFMQPDLFLRLRPGKENGVLQKLQQAGIEFRQLSNSCIAINNATKIDTIIELNKEAVVQDYSSQQIAGFLEPSADPPAGYTAWDCCAASGGKTILLHDLHPSVELTVSDIRESMLINLKKRFSEAGIKNYRSFAVDLSTSNAQSLRKQQYDLIVADVPCSGSGTWSRTPEALYFFSENEIPAYSGLQKKILSTIIPRIKKNGRLVYITCSVFKKENEDIADFIRQQFHLKLEKQQLLKGYAHRADSMFAASFVV